MNQYVQDIRYQREKLVVLEYATVIGSATKTCQELGIPRSTFYDWKKPMTRKVKTDFYEENLLLKLIPENLKNPSLIRLYIYEILINSVLKELSTILSGPVISSFWIQ